MLEQREKEFFNKFAQNQKVRRLFMFIHLKWCHDNLKDMNNDIHIHDTINMVSEEEKEPYNLAGEVFACAVFILLCYHINRRDTGAVEHLSDYLTRLETYGEKSYKNFGDGFILVEHAFTKTMLGVVSNNSKVGLAGISAYKKLTSSFKRNEDKQFIELVNGFFSKKSVDIEEIFSLYQAQCEYLFNDQFKFIYSVMSKGFLSMALLGGDDDFNMDKLFEIAKMDMSMDYDKFMKMMKDDV